MALALALALALASTIPLVWCRRAAIAVFGCTAVPAIALDPIGYSNAGPITVLIALYTLACRSS